MYFINDNYLHILELDDRFIKIHFLDGNLSFATFHFKTKEQALKFFNILLNQLHLENVYVNNVVYSPNRGFW